MDRPSSSVPFAKNEMLIVCLSSHGSEIRGSPVRLTRYVAAFEVYNPGTVLQTSEVLSEFRIILGERTVYSGRAVVRNVVNTGLMVVCEATLEEAWLDGDIYSAINHGVRLREEFDGFIQQWQKLYKVVPEYKIIIADMQSFFMDLRLWLEQVELGIRSSPSANRLQLEQDVLRELGEPIIPAINTLFEKFEAVAEHVDEDLLPAHQAYMKRQLHPLVLSSPFAYRTYHKPLGYAGDYEMVNMIVRNPFEGSTVFAKIVNLWFLMQPPAQAHRNRIAYLQQKLVEETARVAAKGRAARIFNLACGPAIEVQRFLAEKDLSDRAQFTLLDFNEETLTHARAALDSVKASAHRSTPFQFVKRPVHLILKEAGKTVDRSPDQKYDFIYCAGLFDYLSDQVCQRLTNVLYGWLAPGGLLLVTNVDRSNPLRNGMEHLLDWHLIYRTSQQIKPLKPLQAPSDSFTIKSDVTGVNIFLEVRKDNA